MQIRHLIDALPLLAIALVIAAIAPKFFPPAVDAVKDRSDRPKVVTVREKRELPQSEQRQVLKVGDGDTIAVSSGWGKRRADCAESMLRRAAKGLDQSHGLTYSG